jgi:hypothetical protein
MATGIWLHNEDLMMCGYGGLPQEYIDRLAQEFKAYGFTTYKIGNFVLSETVDLVVISEIFKRAVPLEVIENNTKSFKAILGTKAELEEIERVYRETENNAIIV